MGYSSSRLPALGASGGTLITAPTNVPDYNNSASPTSSGNIGSTALSAAASFIPGGNIVTGVISTIGKLFGGSDRASKIGPEKVLQQQLYNGAVLGDVMYARKLYWQTGIAGPPTGGYNENKPYATALWQQLQKVQPKVYAAALAQGAYTEQQGVDMKITAPPVPDPSLLTSSSALNLSSLGLGGNTGLLAAAALAAYFLTKK